MKDEGPCQRNQKVWGIVNGVARSLLVLGTEGFGLGGLWLWMGVKLRSRSGPPRSWLPGAGLGEGLLIGFGIVRRLDRSPVWNPCTEDNPL